jgi:hypothetical protein
MGDEIARIVENRIVEPFSAGNVVLSTQVKEAQLLEVVHW